MIEILGFYSMHWRFSPYNENTLNNADNQT